MTTPPLITILVSTCLAFTMMRTVAGEPESPRAYVDGTGAGWQALDAQDFTNANCLPETWKWTNGVLYCTGQPLGVARSVKTYTNFEMVVQWNHLTSGGNSGLYVWTNPEALEGLKPGQLPPGGIEVQVLDHGYAEQWEREHGKKPDWFTTHGDVFPLGKTKMKPFSPTAPDGRRSFPSKSLSKGKGEWNHYYIRCINGEVRLWVNGQEVSGGTSCIPNSGFLCIESEGAPVLFKNMRIRELP